MARIHRHRNGTLCRFALLACCLGCGNSDHLDRGQLTGTVTLDGEPIRAAALLFRPAQGRAGRGEVRDGEIIMAGTYEANDGLVLGNHKVAVQPIYDFRPKSSAKQNDKKGRGKGSPADSYAGNAPVKIPQKYQVMRSSDLTVEINPGDNVMHLKLRSE